MKRPSEYSVHYGRSPAASVSPMDGRKLVKNSLLAAAGVSARTSAGP